MALRVVAQVTIPLGNLVLCGDDTQLADGVLVMKLLDEVFQYLLKVMYTRLPLYFCRQVSIQKMKTKEEGGGNCEDKDDQEKDGTEEEDRRRNMPNNNTPV